ncbi:peptidase [Candidatus Nitrosotenuis cloacae]|uniref:peptidase n=1 Tax=Candidatus Nitrosotenuis cloacae TaxID=1603555 RepID=UPI000B30D44D|nr:peptidase [Candidatus Nitrosotenuis cloacae]
MIKLLIFAAFFAVLLSVNLAYAQHHGGSAAPPVSFGDKQVTISAALDPADFNPSKDSTAKLNVRFFDSKSNTNIEKVTYRVQILSGETLLAAQMFYDSDGELTVKIQPKSGCAEKEVWRCTKYEGDKDPIVPSALTSSATSTPIMKGPVFDKPGPYTVKVAIIGATNPKTQTTEDIEFETTINIAQEQQLSLATTTGKTPVTVRTFQDEITNFQFTESTNTISFEMPFHWEHAQHTPMIRTDIEIPKSFANFQNVNSFKGTVNGIPIFSKDLSLDTYSNKDTNVLHFVITGEELKMLAKKVTDKHTMVVQIMPDASAVLKSTDVKFSNGYKATISYDPRYGSSKDVSFTMAFFDSSGALAKDIRYAYSVQDYKGKEFIVNTGKNGDILGIPVPSGADSRLITIPSKGAYTLQMYLIGRGLVDFDPYVPASLKFNISDVSPDTKPDTKSDTKPDTKSDTKPDTKSDTKPDTKSDTKPDTKSDTKPDTKSDKDKKTDKKDTKKKDTKKKDTKKKDTKKKTTTKTVKKPTSSTK